MEQNGKFVEVFNIKLILQKKTSFFLPQAVWTVAHVPRGEGAHSLSPTFTAAWLEGPWGHLRNTEVESLKYLTHIRLEEFTFECAKKSIICLLTRIFLFTQCGKVWVMGMPGLLCIEVDVQSLPAGVTRWPVPSWCSTAETWRATWHLCFWMKTLTSARSTSSILKERQRRSTTMPGGPCTMPVWWTSFPEVSTALRTPLWSLRRAARTAGAARASAASRAGCCRRSCASWRKPCCAWCAAPRRSTPPSVPAATPCAARAAPPSSRWGASTGLLPPAGSPLPLVRSECVPALCQGLAPWCTNQSVHLHLERVFVWWLKRIALWKHFALAYIFNNVITLNHGLFSGSGNEAQMHKVTHLASGWAGN